MYIVMFVTVPIMPALGPISWAQLHAVVDHVSLCLDSWLPRGWTTSGGVNFIQPG